MQLSLDSARGEALKREGQASVASANAEFVGLLREEAIRLSRSQGQVDMDALRLWAEARGLRPTHCNAYGAVFLGPHWRQIGFKKSQLASSRGRIIRVWEYQE